jgi:hypothetical protein
VSCWRRLGLLGNDVLKRFNLLVDNRSGKAYFRPNGRISDPFRNPEYYLVRVLLLAAGAATAVAAWFGRGGGGDDRRAPFAESVRAGLPIRSLFCERDVRLGVGGDDAGGQPPREQRAETGAGFS